MSKFLYSKRRQIRDDNDHVPETQQHLSERSTISHDTPARLLALEHIDLEACKQIMREILTVSGTVRGKLNPLSKLKTDDFFQLREPPIKTFYFSYQRKNKQTNK